jgi:hypothetical protein
MALVGRSVLAVLRRRSQGRHVDAEVFEAVVRVWKELRQLMYAHENAATHG